MKRIEEFLSTSTIHGFSHIGSAKSAAVRIFWILVVLLGFGTAIYLISGSYLEWTDSPVASTTITRPIDELQFPEVTVCPPKGSNTVLNQALNQVKDETMTPELRDHLTNKVQEIFVERPSKMFAKDLAHLLNIQSMTNITEGMVRIPEKNRINSAGVSEMFINTSLPKGSFSTPGFKDLDYQNGFYEGSHIIHFLLNISSYRTNERSQMVVEVDVAEEVEWLYSTQDKKMELYQEKRLTFTEAEQFCVIRGGHLASVASEEESREVVNITRGVKDGCEVGWPNLGPNKDVWLGGKNAEGDWAWTDRKPWKYKNWAKNQPTKEKDRCNVHAPDERWWVKLCTDKCPFICTVEQATRKGPQKFVLQGDTISSINIWWKHDSTGEITKHFPPGIRISWKLENMEKKVGNTKIETERSDFWANFESVLHLFKRNHSTWYEAESNCVRNGGHLVSITSQTDFDQVNEILAEPDGGWYWMGGSDEDVEDTWTWSDGRPWKEEVEKWDEKLGVEFGKNRFEDK